MSLAQQWAETMKKNCALTHGDFRNRIYSAFPNSLAAENIAEGQNSEVQVITSWLSSPGHRQNVVGPYNRIGVGRSGSYWVADFVLAV